MSEPLDELKRLGQKVWDGLARDYARLEGKVTEQGTEPLLAAVEVGPGLRLLDLACGPGYAAGEAAMRGAIALGIDLAPEMVRLASQLFPKAEFQEGDAERLLFADASFDAVACGFGLHNMLGFGSAIVEAHRVLRPGARFAFTVPCDGESAEGGAQKEFWRFVEVTIAAHLDLDVPMPEAPPHDPIVTPDQCRRELTRGGFEDVEVADLGLRWRAESEEEFVEFVLQSSPRLRLLLDQQERRAIENVRTALREGAHRFGELCFPSLLASGRKPES